MRVDREKTEGDGLAVTSQIDVKKRRKKGRVGGRVGGAEFIAFLLWNIQSYTVNWETKQNSLLGNQPH